MIPFAFIGMCLAWSLSWFAGKIQSDSFLPIELSAFYRFILTAFFMFLLCIFTKQRLKLKKSEIILLSLVGLFNFSTNFVIGYYAFRLIPSGVVALIFSLSIITSEIITSFFEKRKLEKKVILSGFIGFVGLAIFIIPMIKFNQENYSKIITGFAMSLAMVIVYSIGNFLVGKNKKQNHTPLYTSIAFASFFGSIFLLIFNLAKGNEFTFDYSPIYIFSLTYLVIVASVIAFICLFYLIQNIGSAKANYTALIYPALALIVSSFYEDFKISSAGIIGFLLIILALIIDFKTFKKNQNNES
jgi:drug/metabolite transporter (DMT)-like permease